MVHTTKMFYLSTKINVRVSFQKYRNIIIEDIIYNVTARLPGAQSIRINSAFRAMAANMETVIKL